MQLHKNRGKGFTHFEGDDCDTVASPTPASPGVDEILQQYAIGAYDPPNQNVINEELFQAKAALLAHDLALLPEKMKPKLTKETKYLGAAQADLLNTLKTTDIPAGLMALVLLSTGSGKLSV